MNSLSFLLSEKVSILSLFKIYVICLLKDLKNNHSVNTKYSIFFLNTAFNCVLSTPYLPFEY